MSVLTCGLQSLHTNSRTQSTFHQQQQQRCHSLLLLNPPFSFFVPTQLFFFYVNSFSYCSCPHVSELVNFPLADPFLSQFLLLTSGIQPSHSSVISLLLTSLLQLLVPIPFPALLQSGFFFFFLTPSLLVPHFRAQNRL